MSASSSRRGMRIALGAIFIVVGLVAAVLLWNGASERRNSSIENFARAPIGCDTTLDFLEPGEYFLFLETAGTLDGTRGDCDVEGAFDNTDREAPDVDVTLVDPDGVEVDVDRSFGDIEYDAAGFTGVAFRSVDIEDTDDHVLRVEADVDEVFVVAVGRDPNDGVAALRAGAIAAGLVGLFAGLALVLLGARKSSTTPAPGPWTPGAPTPPGMFVPGGTPPQGPPVYGQHGVPPQYGQQPPPPHAVQPGQHAPPGAPQYAAPHYPAPQYGQPSPYQQPPQGPGSPATQPPPPQVQPPSVAQPDIPGQPNLPGLPQHPNPPTETADSSQPTDWAPQAERAPATQAAPDAPPSGSVPADSDFVGPPDEEPSSQERPPPPPPN